MRTKFLETTKILKVENRVLNRVTFLKIPVNLGTVFITWVQ